MPSSACALSHTLTLSLHDALPISDTQADGILSESSARVTIHVIGDDLQIASGPGLSPFLDDLAEDDPGATLVVSGPSRPLTRLQVRSEEHTSELQSLRHLVCRLLLVRSLTLSRFPYTTLFRSRTLKPMESSARVPLV